MTKEGPQKRKHFVFKNSAKSESYVYAGGGGGNSQTTPRRDRGIHGNSLVQQFAVLKSEIKSICEIQREKNVDEGGLGLQIEFESFPEIELAFESLADERYGLELLNVQHENEITHATVFVPEGELHRLEKKITDYLDSNKDVLNKNTGTKKPSNQKLVDAIHQIRVASVRALWSDDLDVYPKLLTEVFWWEAWLPTRGDREKIVGQFKDLAKGLGFRISPSYVEFPERTIVLVRGSLEQMERSISTLNTIAELRRAKETAEFFDESRPNEQQGWVDNLLQRVTFIGKRKHDLVCLFT